MKKIIFVILVILTTLVSTSAMAEWIRVHGNDKVTVYADPSTIRKKLYVVRIMTLFDFRAENVLADGNQYMSIMREAEFNCREKQQRMISYSIYSGKMGKGKVLDSGSEPQEWKPVSRASIALDMKNFACEKN